MKPADDERPVPRPRRVLPWIAGAYALGVAVGMRLDAGHWFPLMLSMLLLAGGWMFRARAVGSGLLLAAWVLAGWAAATLSPVSPAGERSHGIPPAVHGTVELRGMIAGDPEPGPDPQRVRFPLSLRAVRYGEAWQPVSGRFMVSAPRVDATPYVYGDTWVWRGRLLRSDRTDRPAFFIADRSGAALLQRGGGIPIMRWTLVQRAALAGVLTRGMEDFPEQAGLLRALLLGYRTDLTPRLREVFSSTGTLHIFAISGLHVGVVAVLLCGLLNILGLPRQRWILLLGPLLVLYTMATGMRPSAVRACLMAILYWSAPALQRRPDGPSALAGAALLILLVAPAQLMDTGFLYSFTVVSGLMVFYPTLMRASPAWLTPGSDLALPEVEPGWRRSARLSIRACWSLVALTVAAWLSSAPLNAYFFNLFVPVSLLGNLVVVPTAFVVVLTGCLSLLSAGWPLLTEIFNHANLAFIRFLVGFIERLRMLPAAHWFVRSPPIWMLAVWYAGFTVLFHGRRRARLLTAGFFALLLLVGLVHWWHADGVHLHVTAPPSGKALLVEGPRGQHLLIDTGPAHAAYDLLQFLRSRGVNRLEALVLTHGGGEHAGGAAEVLRSVPVRALWHGPYMEQALGGALHVADSRKIPVRILNAGDRGPLPGGGEWEVLYSARTPRASERSVIVLHLSRGPHALLYMGTGGELLEQALLRRPVSPGAGWLVSAPPRHGAWLTPALLAAVKPRQVVIAGLPYGRETAVMDRTLRRLEDGGIPLHRLDRDGRLTITWPR